MSITMNEYKAIRAEVEDGGKVSAEVAEQVNAFAKARKVKRIPESAIIVAKETVVKEKKAGRPKGEPKPCKHKDHKAEGAEMAPARSNGLCVAHAAKEKYHADPKVAEARKAASRKYSAKIRQMKAEKKALEEAAKAAAEADSE